MTVPIANVASVVSTPCAIYLFKTKITNIGDTKASKFPKRDAKSISPNKIGLDDNRFIISSI